MLLEGQTDTGGDDTASDLETVKDLTEGVEAKGDETAVPPVPEPTKPVSIAAPLSRRAQAEQERRAELKAMADSVRELREGLSHRDRQIAEMGGHLSALAQQRQMPQQQYAPPPPQLPDPDALMEKANQALDGKDMTAYHRYLMQANQAATMRQMAPVLQQLHQQRQAPQAQQIPAELMAHFAAYPEVATHPHRMELLQAKNMELTARGWQDGPQKLKAIFDEARAVITAGQQQARPGFDQRSAAALAGTPTARPTGGSGGKSEPKVELTPEERMYWKKAGFTDETELAQNIARARPDRVVR